jgi:antitoxin (DNA-binding transcriptional repressor) of toxin-antitoxin stability system
VQFSKLLERVMAGEKIGITIRGREVARLISIKLQGHGHAGDSRGSLWFQTISMIPLPKWLQDDFEGKPRERASKSKWNKQKRAT